MRKLCFLTPFIFILLFGCKNDSNESFDLISFAPEQTSVFIKTSSIESLKSVFNNNDLLNEITGYQDIKDMKSQLGFLNYLNPSESILVTLGKTKSDSLQISVITKFHQDLFLLDSVPNRSVETYQENRRTISKITIENKVVYSVIEDSIFFVSTDKDLTESAFNRTKDIDQELKNIYHTANSNKTVSVIINTKQKTLIPSFFLTKEMNASHLSTYFMFDADLSQDQLIFNGITKAVDSSKSLINVFRNTIPQENKLSKICPTDASGLLSFTFNNFKAFSDNLSKYKNLETRETSSIFETASEIGVIYRGTDQAIVVNSLDANAMGDLLLTQNAIETYREVDIYPHDNPELFADNFAPFITFKMASKYMNIDDFFVFTDSDVLMKDIISSYQNATTLSETAVFKSLMEQMSDESSLFVYANAASLNTVLNTNFSEDRTLNIDSFSASAIQFIQDSDFAHVNAIIKKNKRKVVANSVSEDVSVQLEDDLLTDPQLVKNHTNNQMEIVVQDIKNNLYLISNDGKVLWKKQLDGKLLGIVEQIDMYKNGRLQLAFATTNRVYVLDRNGKDVSPFPLKFKDEITQPLSVFDYDNKRDYRLMVTQGKNVLMYDKQANIVTGFTYKKADHTINTQPRHFRIGRKDYIVFVQGNELEILDRVGKTRINVKNNISFSDNDIYLYDNKFTATTVTGDLIQIDDNGKLSSLNLNLGEKHSLAATSKTLVTMSDNILKIKTNRVELDFGNYTSPKIFYLKDKIYVSVTDLQTKKVYLFDSLGKEIPNFPVFGNSSITLDNIDNGKGLEFVTKGDSNSILMYQMN